MNILLPLAKAAIAFVWFVLIVNIFHPFPGNSTPVCTFLGCISSVAVV